MKKLTICLTGSTGAVGKEVLSILNSDSNIEKIITLTRNPIAPKTKEENLNPDFLTLNFLRNTIKADVFICCLGTTIKKAKSKEEFRKVDYDYVVNFAKLAETVGAKKLIVVSSMGADADSRIFYNHVKGIMEKSVAQMNITSIDILRPSLLLGSRKEFRLGEAVAKVTAPAFKFLLIGPLKKYRPIAAKDVAQAIVLRTFNQERGLNILESDQIAKLLT